MKRLIVQISTGGLNSTRKHSVTLDVNNTSPLTDDTAKGIADAVTTAMKPLLAETTYITGARLVNMHFLDGKWRQDGRGRKLKYSKQGTRTADESGTDAGTEVPDYVRLLIEKEAVLNGRGRMAVPGVFWQNDLLAVNGGQYQMTNGVRTELIAVVNTLFNSAGYNFVVLNDKIGTYDIVTNFIVGGVTNRQAGKAKRSTKQKEEAAARAEAAPLVRILTDEHNNEPEGTVFGVNTLSDAAALALHDLKAILTKYGPIIAAELVKRFPAWLQELLKA